MNILPPKDCRWQVRKYVDKEMVNEYAWAIDAAREALTVEATCEVLKKHVRVGPDCAFPGTVLELDVVVMPYEQYLAAIREAFHEGFKRGAYGT
jgi:hypothetical protein